MRAARRTIDSRRPCSCRGPRWPSAVWACAAAAALATASPAFSQPVETENRAAARALGKEGIALYQEGKYVEALDRLSRAHAVVDLTTTGLWRARCLEKLGRLVEAAEQYLEVSRMKLGADAVAVHRQAIDEARQERRDLLPRIPKVRLVARDPVPSVAIIRIDGKLVPPALVGVARPVDPGEHVLVVEHGGEKQDQRFTVAEGASIDLPIELGAGATGGSAPAPSPSASATAPPQPSPPAPEPPDEPSGGPGAQPIIGWVAVGLGGAALIVGGITGGLALDRQSTLDDGCPGGDCPPDFHDDVDAFEAFRTVSAVTLIAGGVLAVGGLTLVLTSPSGDSSNGASTALRFGPSGVRFELRY